MLNFNLSGRESRTTVEKYNFPVLTIHEKNAKDGGVQKLELNAAAVEKLNKVEDGNQYIGLAHMYTDEKAKAANEKTLVLINFMGDTTYKPSKFNKDFSFNSKRIFEILKNQFKFSGEEQIELELSFGEDDGYQIMSMGKIEEVKASTYDEEYVRIL